MDLEAHESYSVFKQSIPTKFRVKRQPRLSEFRAAVGREALRYRDKYFVTTAREEDRQSRWLNWLIPIDYDADWEIISKIDDDVVNDIAQGKRSVEYAIALYYRFHSILDDLSFAKNIDELVFGSPLPEAGRTIFSKSPAVISGGETASSAGSSPSSDDRAAVGITENPNEPGLSVWTSAQTDETRFLYRSRSIPYIHAEEAFAQLDSFVSEPGAFRWHVIYGPGGTGKSRLALEYAIDRSETFEGRVGFLSSDDARRHDWSSWTPTKPVFMIIDYAAREVDVVARIVRQLSLRDDLSTDIRLLLLERDMTGSWFDKVSHRGRAEHAEIEATWSGVDGGLESPDDVWPIIRHMCRDREELLPGRSEALAQLARIDHRMRPLYAAFLGDAYRRAEDPRKWDALALVENVLRHEQRYWEEGGVDQTHINLCACATATGGVPGEWVEGLSRGKMRDFWPAWQGSKTLGVLSSIYGESLVDDIPPLEPDILGEVFFLDQWRHGSRFERSNLLEFGCGLAPWFAEFLERAIIDFPDAASFSLLRQVITSDFHEDVNAKPELLYNIVTGLAQTEAGLAQGAYRMLAELDGVGSEEYVAECVIDASLNLIVGVESLPLTEAFKIYQLQRAWASRKLRSLELDRSRCALALSLIAKYPLEQSKDFRLVLADALRSSRAHPEDDMLRRDACVAISNFVNLLLPDELKHAIRLLRLFRRLARDDHMDDMEDAWAFVLYHVLLLLFVDRDEDTNDFFELADYAYSDLVQLAPEASRYRESLYELLKADSESE